MTAQNYPVTFAYGDVDGVYYTNKNPHRGNDRPTFEGTPIVICGTTIGWTGNTGLTSGPHLHTQAGHDEWCQDTIEPSELEFQPGVVVYAGWGNQWGNFIIMQVGDKFICYAHLSNINVHTGQKVGNDMSTVGEVEFNFLWISMFGPMERNEPSSEDRKRWIGNETNTVIREMRADPRYDAYQRYVKDLEKALVSSPKAQYELVNFNVYKQIK